MAYSLNMTQDFFNKADDEALIKGEHRAYGSTKVKLMVGVGQVLPNKLITKAARTFMEEAK